MVRMVRDLSTFFKIRNIEDEILEAHSNGPPIIADHADHDPGISHIRPQSLSSRCDAL